MEGDKRGLRGAAISTVTPPLDTTREALAGIEQALERTCWRQACKCVQKGPWRIYTPREGSGGQAASPPSMSLAGTGNQRGET